MSGSNIDGGRNKRSYISDSIGNLHPFQPRELGDCVVRTNVH